MWNAFKVSSKLNDFVICRLYIYRLVSSQIKIYKHTMYIITMMNIIRKIKL